MALLWMDGFDHHTSTSGTDVRSSTGILNRDYDEVGQAADTDLITMPGGQGLGLRYNENDADILVRKVIYDTPVSSGTIGIGFHVYYDETPDDDSGDESILVQIGNGADWGVSLCNGGPDQQLYVTGQGGLGNQLGSKGSILTIDTLYHIEMKVVLGTGTSGSVEVRVNGVQDILVENVNTLNLTNGNIDRVGLFRNTAISFQDVYFDDFFIWDGTGTENNDWIGEQFVLTLMPDGDTADEDWTLSSGSDSHALLNDIPPSTSTDISSSTDGDKTRVTLENLPSTDWVPVGVMAKALVDKDNTGTASVEIGVEANGAEDLASGVDVVQSTPTYINHVVETDPDGGGSLTATDVNGLDLVIKLTP